MDSYRYLLPWIVSLDSDSGRFCLFTLGFFSSLLCFFSLKVIYAFKAGADKSYRAKLRLGTAAAVLFLLAGLVLNILPRGNPVFLVLVNIIQCLGINGFLICFFLSANPVLTAENHGRFFYSIFAAGFFVSVLPFFTNLPSAWFIAGFCFLVCAAQAFIALKAKRGKAALLPYVPVYAGAALIAASVFVPQAFLQIALWALPMLFALGFNGIYDAVKKVSALLKAVREVPDDSAPAADTADAEADETETAAPESAASVPAMESVEAEAVSAGSVPSTEGSEAEAETEAAEADDDPESFEELEAIEEAIPAEAGNASEVYKMNPFVPKEFLRLLNKETVMDLKLGDHHEQEMTIFFSDIRQFTDFFESLSPEEGFKFINSYLTRIVPIIEEYGGFVDKYIGDAVMALFPQTNGADMAVQAAIGIQKRMSEYNSHRAKCGYRPLEIGIGIHTGTLMLGVVGVHYRMQNTVISDAVNLASRVEGLTKAFGVSMAISGQTFQKLDHPDNYMFRYLGNVKVKGKGEPTRVYEILNGIEKEIMEKKKQTNMFFEQGLFSFVTRDYTNALENFDKVLEILPEDQASVMYREHCVGRLNQAQAVPAE